MSLKKFVMSGIQDVLENKLSGRGQNNPAGNNTSNQQNDMNRDQPQYGNSGYNQPPQGNYNQNLQYGNAGYNQPPGNYDQNPQYGNSGYNPHPGHPPTGYPQPPSGGGYPPFPGAGAPQGGQAPYPSAGYPAPPGIGFNGYQGNSGNTGGMPAPAGTGYGYPQETSFGGGYPPQQQQQQQPPPQNFYPNQGYGQPVMLGNPSLIPFPGFNANTDAEVLRKAMKGLGCNNSKVISVLCQRTNGQRQEISRAFKVMYGKDLIKELKGELHGDFEDLVLALMEAPAVYDARQLRKAMEGLGTKESVLIEIMTSRTNAQIQQVRDAYRALYKRELENELIGETSGHFKRLLVSLCAGGRDESNSLDGLRANQDARRLYQAGEKRLGTDESTFNAILASQNFAQLRLVFDEYQKVSNHPIERAIDSEFSGDVRDGLLAVVAVVRNRPAYFAKLLNDSMKGLGTRDNDLIRLVVTRAEYDMADIRGNFQAMYRTSLENMIKGDCSGAYKEGLIALVNGNMGSR